MTWRRLTGNRHITRWMHPSSLSSSFRMKFIAMPTKPNSLGWQWMATQRSSNPLCPYSSKASSSELGWGQRGPALLYQGSMKLVEELLDAIKPCRMRQDLRRFSANLWSGCAKGAWKKIQTYSPKWWWRMVIHYGTVRKKNHPPKKSMLSGWLHFLQILVTCSSNGLHLWLWHTSLGKKLSEFKPATFRKHQPTRKTHPKIVHLLSSDVLQRNLGWYRIPLLVPYDEGDSFFGTFSLRFMVPPQAPARQKNKSPPSPFSGGKTTRKLTCPILGKGLIRGIC